MGNITLSLDDEVAQWVRVWAARHNTSVSKMLGQFLAERMEAENSYHAAMQGFLARKPRRLRKQARPFPKRESLHERQSVRR